LGDIVAGHGDLASHHTNQVDHAWGKAHGIENKSIHEGVKLAVNIGQLIVRDMELNGKVRGFLFCNPIVI
jgi:hypothetical protein